MKKMTIFYSILILSVLIYIGIDLTPRPLSDYWEKVHGAENISYFKITPFEDESEVVKIEGADADRFLSSFEEVYQRGINRNINDASGKSFIIAAYSDDGVYHGMILDKESVMLYTEENEFYKIRNIKGKNPAYDFCLSVCQ